MNYSQPSPTSHFEICFVGHLSPTKQMPCAVKKCQIADDPTIWTDPCSTCAKPTHHICANTVHEDEDISLRFCSLACMLNGKAGDQSFDADSQLPLSLDVPSSLNLPSSLDPTQLLPLDVSEYVKVKKVKRPKAIQASKTIRRSCSQAMTRRSQSAKAFWMKQERNM